MFSSIKNSLGEQIGYIDILGPIGRGSMFSDEFSAKQFIDEFRKLEKECSQIVLNISSEGGSVFEGQAIASEIKASKTKTVCKIGALCASIATVISSACDKVIMPENALFMTHAPLSSVDGNAHDLRETADLLDKIEETILNIYEDKFGGKKTRAQIKQLMNGENNDGQGTWMDAYEALEAGFVDEIGHELKMVAQYDGPSNVIINGIKMDLSEFKNTEKIKKLIENKSNNKLEETNMSEISKSGLAMMIDNIANSIKSSLGIKAEVEQVAEIEPETQVEQKENIVAQETNLEVQEESTQEAPEVVETVAEETEAQEENIEPSVEATEEIEPSTEAEPVATVEPAAEIIAEAEQPEVQEEPETTPEVVEPVENEQESTEETEQATEEIEPSNEATVSVPEVNANDDLAKEVAKVKDELNKIKEADAQKAIKLAKAELAKEIGNKFRGDPGKLEDKVELIYELKNSALSDSSKEMIFKSLENLSAQNLKDCEELGHSEEVIVDELTELEQAKAMSKKEGISEGQALLVMSGKRTLAEAKAIKRK